MKLKEYFDNSEYKSIFNLFYKNYFSDKSFSKDQVYELDIKFGQAFNEIKSTEYEESEDKDIVSSDIYIDMCEAFDGESYIDVRLKNNQNNEEYSIDFIEWKHLINKNVVSTLELTNNEIACHILWELTFWAYSSAGLRDQAEEMKRQSEEELEDFDL